MKQSRRHFLCSMANLAVAGVALSIAPSAFASKPGARSLTFAHTHTGEKLHIVYSSGNQYVPGALKTLNRFLRDHYTGQIGRMDPKLFDLLYKLKLTLGSTEPFEIVSGYRCPATNTKLRRKGGGGVAKRSLHMEGKALDLRLADVSLVDLRDAAKASRKGGVGFYPQDGFVHVDTGAVRSW
ncbi:YcbK family protein [Desulfomicrobium apsheronum]|nr:DUF882 domain-containing protein [Desulfomicrobium apsheronum]